MTRPTDPNISIPSAFAINGTKTDFTNEKIQDGFDDTNPDILAGDNLNKFIDDTYKGLNYSMDGVDDLYDVTDDLKDLSNLSATGQAIIDNKASKDLNNLSATGEAHFANPDLSNLSATGQAILDSMANINLSNLSTSGDNRLHALKGYLDNGEVLTDSEGLADVITYAHSTFDLSKFTVTGTPTITDDGIASGLGVNNAIYLDTNIIIGQKPFKIKAKVNYPDTSTGKRIFQCSASTSNTSGLTFFVYTQVYGSNPSGLRMAVYLSDGTNISEGINNISGDVVVEFEFTGSQYILRAFNINNELLGEKALASNLYPIDIDTHHLRIGTNATDVTYDLKYFDVDIDGVPVFSGNITGIDTIKPDDYTVVGTPTISADGIASRFSPSNYLYKDLTFTNNLNWGFEVECIYNGAPSATIDVVRALSTSSEVGWVILRQITSGNFEFSVYDGTNNSVVTYSSSSLQTGDRVKFVCKQLNYSLRTMDVYVNGVKSGNTLSNTVEINTSTTTFANKNRVTIGGNALRTDAFKGSINLNSFKIYVDGNLVYQPCLKIPYTKSKTGSKIADVSVRPRVTDMYEQFGYAPYYTLDEANGNFTLPQGEIYGMINRLQENSNNEIGLPIATLSNTLNDNEIWLEGAEVSKTTYAKLYAVYGDSWGTPANNSNFVLPDFRNKTIWGVDANAGWGYISAGLPNITGNIVNNPVFQNAEDYSNDAFRTTNLGVALVGSGDGFQIKSISFDASRSSGIYGNSNTVQPPSTKVRFKTRFE